MMENLRQQTQSRLDAEFSGRKSEYYLDPKAEQGIKNQPVGVGRYGVQKRIAAFTSVTKDFDINVLKSNDLNLQSVSDPIVLVVKKNKRILNNLIKWLSNSRDNTTGKIMLPMLLIDDEADNASVNTKSEDDSPAAINACIRQLLHEFNQASYLGITATPFANIFINPETEDEMIGDDLFPRDFIYSLAPPTNYIGADKIFGDATEKFSDVLIPLRREEMDLFFPFTHKKTLEVDALPPSMYEAIAYFLLFNAIRDLRGDYTEHRSMMIHVSRFTDVQNRIAEAVNEWLVQVKSDVQNYAALDDEKREQIASLRYLHKVWIRMEQHSRRIFAPAESGAQYETKWFYERAKGQFLQAQMRLTPAKKRQFLLQNPKSKVITKTDLAKVRNTWSEMPHIVSKGAQTNFMKFAELIDEAWTANDSQFNERYFTESVALVILFKHLEALIPRQEWYEQGYRANIVTYSLALLHQLIRKQFKNMELDLQSIWQR